MGRGSAHTSLSALEYTYCLNRSMSISSVMSSDVMLPTHRDRLSELALCVCVCVSQLHTVHRAWGGGGYLRVCPPVKHL